MAFLLHLFSPAYQRQLLKNWYLKGLLSKEEYQERLERYE